MIKNGLPSIPHPTGILDSSTTFGTLTPEHCLEEFAPIVQCNTESALKPPETIQCILDLINECAADEANKTYVDLLSIPCGIGKSTAVSWKIRETLLRNDGHGLIVITDDIARLNDYLAARDPELAKFLSDNKNRITLMDAHNAAEAYHQQHFTPVLLMTTQRFLSMTNERFAEYLTWSGGDRPLILIDEYVPLREIAIISLADINDIATMLEQAIPNTANQVEKQWCIEQWECVRTRFTQTFKRFETTYPEEQSSSFFYFNENRRMTDDDQRFWRFMQHNTQALMQHKHGLTLKCLHHVYYIETHGALYQGRKHKEYSNKLAVMIDHRNRFTSLPAKAIILDGTADLHPDYQQDYVRRINTAPYPLLYRKLDHLTIRIFSVPSSKRRLMDKKNGHRLMQCLIDGLVRKLGAQAKDTPLFTYSTTERFFRKAGFQHVEHFGNIKGSNAYRSESLIVQVGLNRFEPLYYEAYALFCEWDVEQLRAMTPKKRTSVIRRTIHNKDRVNTLMHRMILVDIEQNIYRSAIRNTDCAEDVEYWLFFHAEYHPELIRFMKERYELLDARIPDSEEMPEFKEFKTLTRKAKTPTALQLYTAYISSLPAGTVFTRADILHATGIKEAALKSMFRAHPEHKKRLEDMRIPGKERVYCKQ